MSWLKANLLYICWLIAVLGTAGSLVFSEILGFVPCTLCWYQRICMYPLVIILTVGILKKDRLASIYALALVIVGAMIGIYQNLLVYGVLPEVSAPCRSGIPCNVDHLNLFGFITIPLLSTVAFMVMAGLLYWDWRLNHDERA